MSRHTEEADRYAGRGLDGDNLDEEHRARLLAYAAVVASVAIAEQLERIADALEPPPDPEELERREYADLSIDQAAAYDELGQQGYGHATCMAAARRAGGQP